MSLSLRAKRLAKALRAQKVPALLITHLPDVRWLSGFTGSNAAIAVVLGARGVKMRLFTDGRYTAQAQSEVTGISVIIAQKAVATEACAWLEAEGASSCGFDAEYVTVQAFDSLQHAVSKSRRKKFFLPVSGLVSELRQIKDEDEISAIRKAANLGCQLYEEMLGYIEAGMTETAVAAYLEYRARLSGAEAMSFETIVASGERSSLPHGRASKKKLRRGELLTLDFGVILDGYCSDMTRTVYLGAGKRVSRQSVEQRAVYEAVLEAQRAAIQAVAAGVRCSVVDEAARSVLRAYGLEKEFSHSTGHGVGLEIHEGPRIGAKSDQVLRAGMIITIEPGAYLLGKFGVRIEDMVLVTEQGAEILTPSPKAWTEL